jgi:amino acid adenylation domain-containing protein
MIGHYLNLLEGVIADETQRISQLPLLDEAERNFILKIWNQVEIERQEQCIHRLFETQVELHPNAPAISFQDEHLTYSELNVRSNRIAHGLHTAGVRRGQRVAIILDHGPLQVVSFLGVLKAGASFVCLDPQHPAARLEQILKEVKAACLLTDSYWAARHRNIIQELQREGDCKLVLLNITNSQVLSIGLSEVYGGLSWLETYPNSNPGVLVEPEDLAYIVYTSGSTGTPKGIMQSHDGFCQFIEWMSRQFAIQSPKRIAQWASTTYDAAYAEIFGALCFGAALCMTTPETKLNPAALVEWLKAEKISLFQTVPSFGRQILDVVAAASDEDENPLPHLEYVLLAGETLPVNLARSWLEQFPLQPKLYNLYGPTESVLATFQAVTAVQDEQTSIPIGRAIDGRQIFILDHSRQLCPIGVAGEIYIRSPYLTEGYFGRDEETQKSFVQNPLHDEFPDRVYRTGDLGRWLPEGSLEFFGRTDNQVKIRGIRVELEDIEAALLRHPAVSECAVVAQDYAEGDQRIIAYMPASDELSATILRRFLEESLPDYMMPSAFMFVETLPRTASGKIDRHALPQPDEQLQYASTEFVAPRTSLEEELVGVWKEILRVESIGIQDNFFRLGGHSLLATVVVNKLRQTYGVELRLRSFIESPTVASLAASIETARLVGHQDLGRIEEMLDRVQGLSDDEVKALLYQ